MSKAKFSAGDKVKHAKKGALFSSAKSYSILKYANEKMMALCSDDKTKEEIWIPVEELELIQKGGH